jgi:hypothetical protein
MTHEAKQNLGHSGPMFWPEIAPACGGQIQSPINSKIF